MRQTRAWENSTRLTYRTAGVAALLAALLSGCMTSISPAELPGTEGVGKGRYIETEHFSLFSQSSNREASKALRVYIEGDGQAWLSRHRLSSDPTPRTKLVQRLMAKDHAVNRAYLARPCQYVMGQGKSRNCDKRYWSSHRFSEAVVVAMGQALDVLAMEGQKIELVGYSGGGTIAMLLAARRSDIVSVRTIAGNLDHAAFSAHHQVTPLHGSLNPIDEAGKLTRIPQIHWFGSKDRVIPPFIAEKFAKAQGKASCVVTQEVAQASHKDGWERAFPALLTQPLPCR